MSIDDAALREMAANRGCRLIKSRVRTPGRKDYGKFALEDSKTGRKVFGFGKRGLTATPEEVEQFLRGGTAATWKTSLGATPIKKHIPPRDVPKPETKLAIREAKPADAPAIAVLIEGLGYQVTETEVRSRLAAQRKLGTPTLVAQHGEVVGCLTWHTTPVLHRPKPVGRITMLVVVDSMRSQGIGAALVEAAESRLRDAGCGLIEVTSNLKRDRAHGFYEKLGYERTSYRFGKMLG